VPKKNLPRNAVPTLVQERLQAWGAVIRSQRAAQRLRAIDLCERMEISEATLRRLERGDAGAGAELYLSAFRILGVLDDLAPLPVPDLMLKDGPQRIRVPSKEDDGEYF
jgi:transcriptional regulator with XRE-family HTH domain